MEQRYSMETAENSAYPFWQSCAIPKPGHPVRTMEDCQWADWFIAQKEAEELSGEVKSLVLLNKDRREETFGGQEHIRVQNREYHAFGTSPEGAESYKKLKTTTAHEQQKAKLQEKKEQAPWTESQPQQAEQRDKWSSDCLL